MSRYGVISHFSCSGCQGSELKVKQAAAQVIIELLYNVLISDFPCKAQWCSASLSAAITGSAGLESQRPLVPASIPRRQTSRVLCHFIRTIHFRFQRKECIMQPKMLCKCEATLCACRLCDMKLPCTFLSECGSVHDPGETMHAGFFHFVKYHTPHGHP